MQDNSDFYAEWVAAWQTEHPHQNPPTREEFKELCAIFYLTPEELGLKGGSNVH
jgi:hypothetical protein